IYDNYIENLDPARIYFTAEFLKETEILRTEFERLLNNGNLDSAFAVYRHYLSKVDEYLDYAIAQIQQGVNNMDFSIDESLETDREKAPWAKNDAELKDLWRKRLKDEILRLKIAGKE